MSLQGVLWHIEGVTAANLEKWRMVRRLSWVQARTMGGFKGTEEELWKIESDRVEIENPMEKIEFWKKRLKELGKIK
jgi:hypothetical protein